MYLFINTLTPQGVIILFNEKREILAEYQWHVFRNEFDTLIEALETCLKKVNKKVDDLEGIVVVNGPGAFTSMRIVVLTVNSIAYTHGTPVYMLNGFDMFTLGGWAYPMMIPVNKKEALIQTQKDTPAVLTPIEEIADGEYGGFSEPLLDFWDKYVTIKPDIDYQKLIENISLEHPQKLATPIYSKQPNIT